MGGRIATPGFEAAASGKIAFPFRSMLHLFGRTA
jgi:hypothetical protein